MLGFLEDSILCSCIEWKRVEFMFAVFKYVMLSSSGLLCFNRNSKLTDATTLHRFVYMRLCVYRADPASVACASVFNTLLNIHSLQPKRFVC